MDTKTLFDVSGKVAIVTGASKGLGRAIAGGLLNAGAIVTGVSRSGWDINTERSIHFEMDISNTEEIVRLVNVVKEKFGRIDILVNNAGIDEAFAAEQTPLSTWDRIMGVNLRSMFVFCREVGKIMLEQRNGKIINIASVLGMIGYPEALSYTTSKGGIIQMSRTMAVEWAKDNVNVNCIAPGFFKTDMVKSIMDDPGLWRFSNDKVPRTKVAEPEEIVGSVLFLASTASDYVNGAVLVVDGGEIASGGYTESIMDYYRNNL